MKNNSSVNTTIEGSPFKINSNEASDIVNKTPVAGPAQSIEPIGKYISNYI